MMTTETADDEEDKESCDDDDDDDDDDDEDEDGDATFNLCYLFVSEWSHAVCDIITGWLTLWGNTADLISGKHSLASAHIHSPFCRHDLA